MPSLWKTFHTAHESWSPWAKATPCPGCEILLLVVRKIILQQDSVGRHSIRKHGGNLTYEATIQGNFWFSVQLFRAFCNTIPSKIAGLSFVRSHFFVTLSVNKHMNIFFRWNFNTFNYIGKESGYFIQCNYEILFRSVACNNPK